MGEFKTPEAEAYHHLNEAEFHANPVAQFREWLNAATSAGIREPEAAALATSDKKGNPHARIVLLRQYDTNGFIFYTNYNSHKGQELADNPRAALLLYWEPLGRQIRIEGKIDKTEPEISDRYFQQRPRDSQIAAWASSQSEMLENYTIMENRFKELKKEYEGQPVPRPPHWGGYRLLPALFEFWQSGPHRLHDRILYRKNAEGKWIKQRLYP